MMHEELEECESIVRVAIKYDYNIQRADMFHDHVGMVRVFAIDADNGTVVHDTVISNRDNNNAFKTDSTRYYNVTYRNLPAGRNYRFMAVALQRPYDETQAHTGDKFVGTFPTVGSNADALEMKLTRNASIDTEGRFPINAPDCGLDTLWIGNTMNPVYLPNTPYKHVLVQDTISLVRDTKYLSLTLRQIDSPKDVYDEDFYVEITDNNGWLAWDNSLKTDDKLLYTPHAQWTTEVLNSANEVTARAAHYDISFSRLMYYTGADALRNASLCIFRKSDGTKVVDINLPSILAEGRNLYEIYNYSPQEYLDREYDYDLQFFLLNGEWQEIHLKINVTAWVIRRQDVTF